MELIPVEGNTGLFRDSKSGAILNCSSSDFSAYLSSKERRLKELQQFDMMNNKINELENLKTEVTEIKDMMKLILSKLDSNS